MGRALQWQAERARYFIKKFPSAKPSSWFSLYSVLCGFDAQIRQNRTRTHVLSPWFVDRSSPGWMRATVTLQLFAVVSVVEHGPAGRDYPTGAKIATEHSQRSTGQGDTT
jgi:hypothetical protein